MLNRKNIRILHIICFSFILLLLPLVSAVEIKPKPTDDDVELYIWGGFAFHWKVVNHKNESIYCKINIDMKNFLGMENEGWEYFTVPPHTIYKNWNDCYPMPFFHTYVTLTAYGEKTLKRNGLTLFGFNVFLTKEVIYDKNLR